MTAAGVEPPASSSAAPALGRWLIRSATLRPPPVFEKPSAGARAALSALTDRRTRCPWRLLRRSGVAALQKASRRTGSSPVDCHRLAGQTGQLWPATLSQTVKAGSSVEPAGAANSFQSFERRAMIIRRRVSMANGFVVPVLRDGSWNAPIAKDAGHLLVAGLRERRAHHRDPDGDGDGRGPDRHAVQHRSTPETRNPSERRRATPPRAGTARVGVAMTASYRLPMSAFRRRRVRGSTQ